MDAKTLAAERSSLTLGYFFAATGAILFSTKAIIVKLAYELNVDAETLLALRLGLSLPFYLVIGLYSIRDRRQKSRRCPRFRSPYARASSARSAGGAPTIRIFLGCNISVPSSSA